jgi:hypothetical protein
MRTVDGVKVVTWIADRLDWARSQGWDGKVVSGYRTYREQQLLHDSWRRGERPGPVAKPGQSNHQGRRAPRGAVDVTQGDELERILQQQPDHWLQLKPFGPGDRPHFSATGR